MSGIDATQKALELAIAAEDIRRRATRYIEVGGKRYKLRTMTTYLSERLTALSYDALLYEREIKKVEFIEPLQKEIPEIKPLEISVLEEPEEIETDTESIEEPTLF